MSIVAKVGIGLAALAVGTILVAGRAFQDVGGYVRAGAETTVDNITGGLPREVRDKKLENDLGSVRTELVERRVKLNQSARQIEQLSKDVTALAERNDRDRRLLAEAYPALESATKGQLAKVRFASAEMPLAEFQKEVDDLLARRDRDSSELKVKREALGRLETRQKQAELALSESQRALETAEREVSLLKSRRDHAEIEARTIALVGAITDSLKAPRESVGESLGRLRDEVTQLESRNDAERSMAPAEVRSTGGTITKEFDRLQALRGIRDEVQAEAAKTASTADPLD